MNLRPIYQAIVRASKLIERYEVLHGRNFEYKKHAREESILPFVSYHLMLVSSI